VTNPEHLLLWFISENFDDIFMSDAKISMEQFHGSKVEIRLISSAADAFNKIMFHTKKLRLVEIS
jgi:hypothetical protein